MISYETIDEVLDNQKQKFHQFADSVCGQVYRSAEEYLKNYCPSHKYKKGEHYQLEAFIYDYKFATLEGKEVLWLIAKLNEVHSYQTVFFKVTDFPLFVDVQVNTKIIDNPSEWHSTYVSQIEGTTKQYKGFKLGQLSFEHKYLFLKQFKGYRKDPQPFIRYYFKQFWMYEAFINCVKTVNNQYEEYCAPGTKQIPPKINKDIFERAYRAGVRSNIIQLSEDDSRSNYMMKIQRHHEILLSGWSLVDVHYLDCIGSKHTFKCSILNIQKLKSQPALIPLSILSWDIEVSSESGNFDDDGFNPNNNIISIGGSYYQCHDGLLKKFCVTFVPSNQGTENDTDLIIVENEKKMILEFAKLINIFKPSVMTGFNDFHYDYPFLKKRIQAMQIDQQFMENAFAHKDYICNQESAFGGITIKIDADSEKKGEFLDLPGIICADTRILLMKSQKIDKKSLNEYLKANGLEQKLGVDFNTMNRLYRNFLSGAYSEQDRTTMTHVMEYCAHDADSCKSLWLKRNILREQIEISSLSYTPLRCAFHNADGVKVRNMIALFAKQQGFTVPMSSSSKAIRWNEANMMRKYKKYPGAYVPSPIMGVNITPVVVFDFASLYPSLIIAHNLSPENVVVEEPFNTEKNCTFIDFEFDNNEGDGFVRNHVVDHTIRLGIFPQILADLFAKRLQIKAEIEHLEKQPQDQEVKFKIQLLDIKQRALKVYMNTFYGEAGNQKSPLFDITVAGGTTYLGRKYIKQVHAMVQDDLGCERVYGDTDSVMCRPLFDCYQLKPGQSATMYDLIHKSIEIAEHIKAYINEKIGAQTRGKLKIVFEEVLCPSLFALKKKYCGLIHKPPSDIATSVQANKLLIKGIEYIKKQFPQIVKEQGYNMISSLIRDFYDNQKQYSYEELKQICSPDYRKVLNDMLLKKVEQQMMDFTTNLLQLDKQNYKLLATKKKIKLSSKGGEMKLFNQRFDQYCQTTCDTVEDIFQLIDRTGDAAQQVDLITRLCACDLEKYRVGISKNNLISMGIEVPQDGEYFDVLYVEQFQGAKISQKMAILEQAVKQGLQVDTKEYVQMFMTTANQVLACNFEAEKDSDKIQLAARYLSKYIHQSAIPTFEGADLILQHFKQLSQKVLNDVFPDIKKQFKLLSDLRLDPQAAKTKKNKYLKKWKQQFIQYENIKKIVLICNTATLLKKQMKYFKVAQAEKIHNAIYDIHDYICQNETDFAELIAGLCVLCMYDGLVAGQSKLKKIDFAKQLKIYMYQQE